MTKINTLIALAFLATNIFAQEGATSAPIVKDVSSQDMKSQMQPYYQGEIVTIDHAGAYSYIEVKEHSNKTFWIAVSQADAKVGDYVRFKKELVTQNFTSKSLNKTFDELMFASDLQYRVSQ